MVRAGTSITYQVQGNTQSWYPPDPSSLRAGVIAFLSAYFFVETAEVNVRSVSSRIMSAEFWNYDYTAIVTVVPRSDYGSSRDIASVIQHAFYTATGGMPTVGTDFRDTIGGISEQGLPNPFKDLAKLPQMVIVGIVIIVGLIAFSPTGKALGGSFRL